METLHNGEPKNGPVDLWDTISLVDWQAGMLKYSELYNVYEGLGTSLGDTKDAFRDFEQFLKFLGYEQGYRKSTVLNFRLFCEFRNLNWWVPYTGEFATKPKTTIVAIWNNLPSISDLPIGKVWHGGYRRAAEGDIEYSTGLVRRWTIKWVSNFFLNLRFVRKLRKAPKPPNVRSRLKHSLKSTPLSVSKLCERRSPIRNPTPGTQPG